MITEYNCLNCKFLGSKDAKCEECSVIGDDDGCSCHLGHPPCGFCTNLKFEEK